MSAAELGRAVTEPRAEITPRGAYLLLHCMADAEKWWKRNGGGGPAGWRELYVELGRVAIAAGMMPMLPGRPAVESAQATFANPIGTTQAAHLLGITPRGVRDLCVRGVLASAAKRSRGWVMERDEVLARATQRCADQPKA